MSPSEHKHEWHAIGETTHNGDTWMQVTRVFHCPACDAYALARSPHKHYLYERRKPEEVARLRAEEQAAYDQLLTEHKADPAGVEERYRVAEAAHKALVQEAIARSRADRGPARNEVKP